MHTHEERQVVPLYVMIDMQPRWASAADCEAARAPASALPDAQWTWPVQPERAARHTLPLSCGRRILTCRL